MENSPLLFVLHVAGAAALLIWAVRLVRTGVERGWSVQLRRWLRHGGETRWVAAVSGMVAAILLQSSTAVAILTSNFVAAGTLAATAGLAILLGADVGSAIVAQILLSRADWAVPLLLVAGVGLFLKAERREYRQAGRVLIGLALVFVSLGMIRDATEPLRDAPALVAAMRYLGGDPITAFAIGALFAWAVHSSVAAVLLFVTLAAEGVLPVPAGMAMVLGANLGGALIAFVLTLSAEIEARRIVVANLALRGGGAALALAALSAGAMTPDLLGATPARQVINLHLAFNLVLALLSLPITGPVLGAARKLVSVPATPAILSRVSALDAAALTNPDRALACASREILQMGEGIEAMLRSVIGLYDRWDDQVAEAITAKEAEIDKMHFETKLYLAKLNRTHAEEDVTHKGLELANMAVNLESAGDAIARSMVGLAKRLNDSGTAFSETGRKEVRDFHDRVLSNAQSALNVLMTLNPDAARALVEEKEHVRALEQDLQRSHLDRLKMGRVESIETSNIHQETLRALKQINTAFSMVAYPILSETGDLLSSRLAKPHRG
ncbi:Na/Pi cotransporter family protein [Defluviimonas sp. WL0075]|uniref:Na/Pi cotransporter family protein n=1 Tax=Albidovulum sediminicola TaxID=2984331 RepID=A0ABT2Z1I6_9RHOB|nr:Na/Pi cotransporter family protein [Defluviimonas sp. WL0075]MCV2864895.1 Na/Pi cotransporter family protein [Defluviimonas sp. WL0075]